MHTVNTITRSLWLATTLSGSLGSLPAFAEDQANAQTPVSQTTADAGPTLKSVTVTAERREESVQDIANAVTAVEGKNLGQTGTDYIGKAIKFVPNAQANNPDGDARPRWYIRGVGTGDQGAATAFPVGVYVDDVYLNAPLAGGDPLFDLDRIEILRGPQGTLYGKNTTGGAVNILTTKPSFDNAGYATLGYGSKNEKIVNTALGGTLVEDRLAARISLYSKERDGFIKNVYDDKDYDHVDNQAVRLQFLAKINPDLTALWSLHNSENRGNAAGLLPVGRFPWLGGYTRDNPDRRYIDSNVDNKSKIEHAGTSLTFNYDLGDYRLTSISAYDETKQRTISDDDLSPVESGRDYNNNRWRQYSQEFRIASPTSETLRWILGTHFFHENLQSAHAVSALPDAGAPEASFSGNTFDHEDTSYALFGNLAYDFTEQFTLTGGLRWTREKKDIDLDLTQTTGSNFSGDWWDAGSLQNPVPIVNAGTTTNGNEKLNKTWSALTYDLTPEYRLTDNLRVYARYAKGFRSGAFNTGISSSLEQLSTVKPETLNSYELGLKSEWLNGRVHANANVFYYNYDDMQVSATTTTASGSLVSMLTNGAEGKARGAELELEAQATDNLHLQLSASLFDSEFTGDLWKGNSFIRSPRHIYALGADYRIPLDIPGSLVLGGDLRYQSKEYFISAYQNAEWTWLNQGGYTVSNAHLGYTTADEKYNITGFVNNLTDKQYQNHGISLNRGNSPYWVSFGDPRTAGVTVTAKF